MAPIQRRTLQRSVLTVVLTLIALIAILCGLTTWSLYRERRLERLNRDLIAAVNNNDTNAVISLLDQGADANCHDEPYRPLPWWTILRDQLRGVKPKTSTAPTPLLLALEWKHLPDGTNLYPPENLTLITALLDHKADVNVKDEIEFTPLAFAIDEEKKATVHLLLKYGADVRADGESRAALVGAMAVFFDSTDVLTDMLQRGADVNQRDDYTGNTALLIAIDAQNVEAVRLLLSYHADVTLLGDDHLTPLAMAMKLSSLPGEQQIIQLLKQAGAKE